MEKEPQQIFEEQILKLPNTVVSFLASSNWNDELEGIASMYNLAPEQISNYKQEAALVLAGLVHPNEFSQTVAQEAGLQGAVLEAVVAATEQKIFATVRPALVDFFEHEEELPKEAAPVAPAAPLQNIAPPNLPVAPEPEHLIPPIPPKTTAAQIQNLVAPHPFEEKMKHVLTAGESSAGSVVIEPPKIVAPPPEQPIVAPVAQPETQTVSIARNYHADPYREPIE